MTPGTGFHYLCIFLVFIVVLPGLSTAAEQAPSILWFKVYGQEGDDDALNLLRADDGYFIGGMTESPEMDIDDAWIKKISPEGETSFTRYYDMSILDEARAIIPAGNGNLVMGGAVEPYGESFPQDAAVILIDQNGTILWNMSFGDPMIDETVLSLTARSDGGYVFSGHAEDWRTGSMEAMLVSLNKTGAVEWFRKYPRGTASDAQSVLALENGFLIGGYADLSGTGDFGGWLMRTDNTGDLLWERVYGNPGKDAIHRIIPVSDGNFAISGERQMGLNGTSDCWAMLVDPSGDVIWEKTFGGSGNDKAFDISIPPSGGYLVSGWTESYGAGLRDAWVIRLDSSGEPLWSKTIGGPQNDMASSADEQDNGSIIVAGLTDSYGAGKYDAMAARLGGDEK